MAGCCDPGDPGRELALARPVLSRGIELVVANYFPDIRDDHEFKTFSEDAVPVRWEHLPIEGHNVALLASTRHCAKAISSIAHKLVVRFANAPLKFLVSIAFRDST
jgi:hypothetical protein